VGLTVALGLNQHLQQLGLHRSDISLSGSHKTASRVRCLFR
jgi:hypothetical protein